MPFFFITCKKGKPPFFIKFGVAGRRELAKESKVQLHDLKSKCTCLAVIGPIERSPSYIDVTTAVFCISIIQDRYRLSIVVDR
jgi:hypothetical protein